MRNRAPFISCLAGLVASVLAGTVAAAAELRRSDRIVALGGAVTEILYDLGVADRIVAVDTTSLHPPAALATKQNVGYFRQASAEGILSVRPSLILAAEEAGPPDALKLVEDAGIPVVRVSGEPTAAGVSARIAAVAREVGQDDAGRRLIAETERRFASLAELRARIAKPAKALFILSLQNGRALVGGRNTAADGMFGLAGAENAAAAIEGFKPMTDEAILAAQPDMVVMMDLGPNGSPSPDVLTGPALAGTPAAKNKRLVVMDGLYLLGFGPRTPDAARDLLIAMYPSLATR